MSSKISIHNCLASSLIECPPATQATGVRFSAGIVCLGVFFRGWSHHTVMIKPPAKLNRPLNSQTMHENRYVKKMGMSLVSAVQYGGNRYIKVHILSFSNLFIDASGDKDTSHPEVGGEGKRCLDDVIRLCRVMQLFQLMYYCIYSIYSICTICLYITFMLVFQVHIFLHSVFFSPTANSITINSSNNRVKSLEVRSYTARVFPAP
jgi:hypothetical protein